MAIEVQNRVWEHSRAKGTELLLLIKIADYANEQGLAFPSVTTLAKKIRMSERSTQYALAKLQELGELQVMRNAGPHGCNLYRVHIGEGAKFAGVKLASGVQPASLGGEAGCTEGVKPIAPKPSLTINEPSEVVPNPRAKRVKKAETTLAARMAECKAQGVPVVPADGAAIRFAQAAGIPDEFIELAWGAFVSRYTEDQPNKTYADWAQAFTNAVKGNWLKLWFFDTATKEYKLTTPGQQEQNAQKARTE
jgi:hypothetical protein